MQQTTLASRGLATLATLVLSLPLFAAAAPCASEAWAVDSADADAVRTVELIGRGDYKNAETVLRRAVEALRGTPDQRLVSAQANLGVALFHQGRYSEAEVWYGRALELASGLGAPPSETAAIRLDQASVYRRTGRLADAADAAREAVHLRELEGRDSAVVATALVTLTAINLDQGRYPDAESNGRRAVVILTRAGACCQAQLANALAQLAKVRIGQRDYDEADSLLAQAIRIGAPLWGPHDPRLASAHAGLGALRIAQRNYEEARLELEKALAIWRAFGGDNRIETATALNNLAQSYKLAGQYRKAEPVYKQAIASCDRWLGEGHPTCLLFVGNFADMLRLRGDLRQAQDVLAASLDAAPREAQDTSVLELLQGQLSGISAARQAGWTVRAESLRTR
jgi:tetratricopeptide (TPR) repeat protein